jgi:choline dehydrogenase
LIGTALDWNYATEPEPGLNGRSIKWPRGRSYGGSSTINAMAYTRGHQLCYDAWAREAGPAWSYRELLPLFRRVEHNSRGASDVHGGNGPLAGFGHEGPACGTPRVSGCCARTGFHRARGLRLRWPAAGRRRGFLSKEHQDGRRHSAAAAFLVPALGRPNLVVWSNSRVLKLTFEGQRATGVEVVRSGAAAPTHIRARREVILSAGAIESPKLLMLSGVGPADDLRRHRIPVVLDLPGVGGNLQDHLRVPVRWAARQPLAPSTVSAGLFTYSTAAAARRPQAAPDIQFYVGRGLDSPDPFITLTIAMSQPASRGRISLRSADPAAPPVIKANYLSEAGDLDAMLDGVRLAQSLAAAGAYASLRGDPVDPGPSLKTDAALRSYIRASCRHDLSSRRNVPNGSWNRRRRRRPAARSRPGRPAHRRCVDHSHQSQQPDSRRLRRASGRRQAEVSLL